MINRKPNMNAKYFFLLIVLLGLYSCKNRESLSFEKYNLTTDMLPDCRNEDCALLEINLLKIVEDHQIAYTINREIESVVCDILNTDKNESAVTIEEAINQFNRSYQTIISKFPDEAVPYEANIDCKISFQSKNIISMVIDFYVYTGGAHGYGGTTYINMSTKTGKRFLNKALFTDHNGFKNYAEKIFRSKNGILQNESINSTGFFFENDIFSLPENIGFTDTDVVLHYNPYEISSYADGPIELKLNKEEVASFFAIEIF